MSNTGGNIDLIAWVFAHAWDEMARKRHQHGNGAAAQRIEDASAALDRMTSAVTQWDEMLIRQIVDTVRVASAEEIIVTLKNGEEIEQSLAL